MLSLTVELYMQPGQEELFSAYWNKPPHQSGYFWSNYNRVTLALDRWSDGAPICSPG